MSANTMAGTGCGQKSPCQAKSVNKIEIKQQHVIKFIANERMREIEIISRLRNHYGKDALSRTQVYFWINEARPERTDLNTIACPGRDSDESIVVVIAGTLDADPHFSGRKLGHSLGIVLSTV
jgi:hypothetical protein